MKFTPFLAFGLPFVVITCFIDSVDYFNITLPTLLINGLLIIALCISCIIYIAVAMHGNLAYKINAALVTLACAGTALWFITDITETSYIALLSLVYIVSLVPIMLLDIIHLFIPEKPKIQHFGRKNT